MQSLFNFLSQCPDHRRLQGQRVPFACFLEMVVLAGMSGHFGLRSVARFIQNNADFFESRYALLHGVPSGSSVQNFLSALSYEQLNRALFNWTKQYLKSDSWLSIDGKVLASTVSDSHGRKQNFKTIISMFCQEKEIVVLTNTMENKKSSEIHSAEELIKGLELKGITFTMDALHCKKKPRRSSWIQEMSTYSK